MLRFAALLLALIASDAHAYAPACVPDKYGVTVPMHDGLTMKYGRHSAGWWVYWFCEAPSGAGVTAEGFWCAHGECKTAEGFAADLRAIAPGVAADPVAATKAALAGITLDPNCANHPSGSARRQVCDHRRALVKADRAKLTILHWIVAPAGATANPPNTLPAYPWANGARGSVSNGRAPEGTACDKRIGKQEGSTYWYGVNGRADQVARCVQAALTSAE